MPRKRTNLILTLGNKVYLMTRNDQARFLAETCNRSEEILWTDYCKYLGEAAEITNNADMVAKITSMLVAE
jgi:hypothetical protein